MTVIIVVLVGVCAAELATTLRVYRQLKRETTERQEYQRLLAESHKLLDRIALLNDQPSRDLSKMASDFIVRNKLRLYYGELH